MTACVRLIVLQPAVRVYGSSDNQETGATYWHQGRERKKISTGPYATRCEQEAQ